MQAAPVQPERLRAALEAAGVSHGSRVTADLLNIGITGVEQGRPVVAFCFMEPIVLRQTFEEGDGGLVPKRVEVFIHDLHRLKTGLWNFRLVEIETNGRIAVTIGAYAELVRVE